MTVFYDQDFQGRGGGEGKEGGDGGWAWLLAGRELV